MVRKNSVAGRVLSENWKNSWNTVFMGVSSKTYKETLARAISKSKRQLNGDVAISWTSDTPTPAAAENCVTKLFSNIDTDVQALDEVQDNNEPVMDSAFIDIQLESTTEFVVIPFLALLENGETIVETSGTNPDPNACINTAITGVYQSRIGEVTYGRPFRDNGSKYQRAELRFDMSNLCRTYMQHVNRAAMEEESPLQLKLGLHIICRDNNTAVTVIAAKTYISHTKPTEIAF